MGRDHFKQFMFTPDFVLENREHNIKEHRSKMKSKKVFQSIFKPFRVILRALVSK